MPTNPLYDALKQRQGQARRPPRPISVRKRNTRRTATIIGIVVALVIAILILFRVLGFYLDWLWFGEVGFRTVFWRGFWVKLAVGAAGFALFFIILWPNLELARRMAPEFRATEGQAGEVVEMVRVRARSLALWVGLAVSAVASLIAGFVIARNWQTFLNAVYSEPFGTKDPIFGHDIAFYVFTAPAWHSVQTFVFAAVFVTLILTAAAHVALAGDFTAGLQAPAQGAAARIPRPKLGFQLPKRAIGHLSALLAAVFVVLGAGELFKAWDYLTQSSGVVFGISYTDDHARVPAARILMVVAFVIAAVLIFNIFRRLRWWPYTIVAWVAVFVVVQWIYPAIIQGLVVNPNELDKERAYLGHTLTATKRAYGLNDISTEKLTMKKGIDADSLAAAEVTVRNVRLWDPGTLVTSYRQLQELRPYYSFVDADVDRYTVNGVLRQTMLSARELNIGGLPSQAQTWVNQHITYTHGYGIALSAVNQVTSDGSPDFLVSDVPPVSAAKELQVDEPRIYYGEIGTDYTLVRTTMREFDYPGADTKVFTEYKGKGGISTASFLTKMALAWRFKTIKFFTTKAITDESRVILVNNVSQRLAKAAPFLVQDKDPYMVVAGGKLMWIVDCYTTTDRYPYSDSTGSLNYIRNSVKAVIDAYNGTIDLYVFDDEDPLLRTYDRVYPGLLKPLSEMPADLREHVRYPEGYFNVQAQQYATYHVNDAGVLYNKDDQWQIPDNVALEGEGPMSAYYVILRLPNEDKEEFTLMLPFVPNGRKNMVSWLGARSDGADYGKAVNIQFPKGENVYGPSQVEAAINQDPVVSEQLTLWGQRGSKYIMGNLLVEPIFDSLLYIQPLYLQAEETELPQLKEVVVFYRSAAGVENGPQGQYVAMQPTLKDALLEIFGEAAGAGGTGAPTPSPTTTGGTTPTPRPTTSAGTLPADVSALIEQANNQFEAAQAALKAGDFAEYGRQIELLKATLAQLEALR